MFGGVRGGTRKRSGHEPSGSKRKQYPRHPPAARARPVMPRQRDRGNQQREGSPEPCGVCEGEVHRGIL